MNLTVKCLKNNEREDEHSDLGDALRIKKQKGSRWCEVQYTGIILQNTCRISDLKSSKYERIIDDVILGDLPIYSKDISVGPVCVGCAVVEKEESF